MDRMRMALALLVLPILALGGCAGDPPRPKMAPSESSTPSQSSAAQSPSGSPAAQKLSETATVRRFFEEVSASITTGDSGGFMSHASKKCINCHELATSLAKAYAGGGHIEDGRWTIRKIDRVNATPGVGLYDVEIAAAKERWFNGQGKLVKIVTADQLHFKVVVTRSLQRWQIRELRLV